MYVMIFLGCRPCTHIRHAGKPARAAPGRGTTPAHVRPGGRPIDRRRMSERRTNRSRGPSATQPHYRRSPSGCLLIKENDRRLRLSLLYDAGSSRKKRIKHGTPRPTFKAHAHRQQTRIHTPFRHGTRSPQLRWHCHLIHSGDTLHAWRTSCQDSK